MPLLPRTPSTSRTRITAIAAVTVVATLGIQAPAQAAPAHAATAHAPAHATAPRHATHTPPRSPATPTPTGHGVQRIVVPADTAKGFGGGTVYLPAAAATPRKAAAVIVTPGFTNTQKAIAWYGPALAAEGFITFTIDTLDTGELSDKRAAEMVAAADFLKKDPAVAARLDPSRIALAGYSLGGGGALLAASRDHGFRAVVALAPFFIDDAGSTTVATSAITTPTLIVTGRKDDIAQPATMGKPFYDGLPATTPRQYIEITDATHSTPEKSNADILRTMTAFLEVHLDGDSSYAKLICPAPVRPTLSVSLSHCG